MRAYHMASIFVAACAALLAAPPCRAIDSRLFLANQSDYLAKRGFYLGFENSAPEGRPSTLSSLRLILGVGDGAHWHYVMAAPAWEMGEDYTARAIIAPTRFDLFLNGKLAGGGPGGLTPLDSHSVDADLIPDWASGPTGYRVLQTSVALSQEGGKRAARSFAPELARPAGLAAFEPNPPARITWTTAPRRTLTVTVRFRFAPLIDLALLQPLVDRYGQARPAHWRGKVASDADMRSDLLDEKARLRAMPPPSDRDRFGGVINAGWRDPATGRYTVARRSGFWWLVTPDGNPCFYTGLCAAPALTWDPTPVTGRESVFAWLPPHKGPHVSAWMRDPWGADPGVEYVTFQTTNLIRKYGDGWQERERAMCFARLRSWGFSGLGKWCGMEPNLPVLPVLGLPGVARLERHPDIFDPAVRIRIRSVLRAQIEPRVSDPWVVGWSIGNEYDEIVTKTETAAILARPAATPAKRALVDYAVDTIYGGDAAKLAAAWAVHGSGRDGLYSASPKPPPADIEALRRFYEDRYYDCLYRAVKEIDPGHLYLGCWIVPGWWENDEDWRLIARHCDVIGYDRYDYAFADDHLLGLIREADKPILCGEFSYPPTYDGARGYGVYPVRSRTDGDAGALYARYVRSAAENPWCVGAAWFEYHDEPLTGRGAGHGPALVYGEHYAFGLVDVTDRPKWDLVRRIRAENLQAASQRAAANRRAAIHGPGAPGRGAPAPSESRSQ